MGKTIKVGKMIFDVKSLAVGMLVCMVGLSIPPTASMFEKLLISVKNTVGGFFKKK